jgi:hypothetical protein
MHDSDASTTSDVRGKPGGAGADRRELRDRIIGLLGVLFRIGLASRCSMIRA